jgi:hypothetical protein
MLYEITAFMSWKGGAERRVNNRSYFHQVHGRIDSDVPECRRICTEHKKELKPGPSRVRPSNKLYCPEGHRCTQWLVINSKGEILGAEPPAILDSYLKESE